MVNKGLALLVWTVSETLMSSFLCVARRAIPASVSAAAVAILVMAGPSAVQARATPSGIPSGNEAVQRGYLPVTLYGAVSNDAGDDTAAIQRAIDDAFEFDMVAFFPSGVYRVSDTLRAMQPSFHDERRGRWRHIRDKCHVLAGSTVGERPRLVLADNAPGFDDPDRPKPLVWIWAQARKHAASGKSRNLGSENPLDEQSNISFNQVFKGIDIDLRARGNRGAAGIHHAGSQGSTIEDVEIWAAGAHAGIMNPPGQGGGSYNIQIHGGDYGVLADNQSRFPILAGLTLEDQEKAAILWRGQSNMTVAGFRVSRRAKGPALTLPDLDKPIQGALTLVDGVFETGSDRAIENVAGNNLVLRDVWFSGARELVRSGGQPPVRAQGQWTKVSEYAYSGRSSLLLTRESERAAGSEAVRLAVSSTPDHRALIAQHLWGADFPSFEHPGVVNAVDYGAEPDDNQDDTAALARAFAASGRVFLPPGVYLVSKTLEIPKDGQLLGAAKHLSLIRAAANWYPSPGTPLVTTAGGVSSRASLSFIGLEAGADQAHTPLVWKAGRDSIVRDILVSLSPRTHRAGDKQAALRNDTYRISGGGRWYAIAAPWNTMRSVTRAPAYRHLRIDGTREPIAMYGLNLERSLSSPQFEITDAQHVRIYYLKSETLDRAHSSVLAIKDSKDIAVYGYSGVATPVGRSLFDVQESSGLFLANLMPLRAGDDYDTLLMRNAGNERRVTGRHALTLVYDGNTAAPAQAMSQAVKRTVH